MFFILLHYIHIKYCNLVHFEYFILNLFSYLSAFPLFFPSFIHYGFAFHLWNALNVDLYASICNRSYIYLLTFLFPGRFVLFHKRNLNQNCMLYIAVNTVQSNSAVFWYIFLRKINGIWCYDLELVFLCISTVNIETS